MPQAQPIRVSGGGLDVSITYSFTRDFILSTSILAGVKLTSASNSSPAEILLSGANDTAGLLPVLNPTTGAQMSGGALITVNPSAQTPGYTETLIQGQAQALTLVFDSNGYFTFNLNVPGAYPLVSQSYRVNTEHSVGLSYDTSSGQVIMVVDGAAVTNSPTTASFTSNPPAPYLALGSFSNAVSTPGNFNGFIDQLLLFNAPQTSDTLVRLTSDPKSVLTALSTTSVGSVVLPSHLETATTATVTTVYATGILGQNFITTYADGTSTNSTISSRGVQIGDTISGMNIPSNAVVNAINSSGAVYYTSITSSANSSNFSNLSAKEVVAFVHPGNFSTSVSTQSTGTTLNVASVNGIEIGDTVSGKNISTGISVVAITGPNSVTLSIPILISAPVSQGTAVNFMHQSALSNLQAQTSSASTSGASTLNVYSSAGIQIGDIVSDAYNILTPETVTGISGTTLTLSSPNVSSLNVAGVIPINDTLTFVHPLSPSGIPLAVGSSYPFVTASTSNAAVVSVLSATGVLAGDYVFGANIANNTKVQNIGTDGSNNPTLTLSASPANSITSSSTLVLSHPDVLSLNGTVSSSSATLSFTQPVTVNTFTGAATLAGDGVMVGDYVAGPNIPIGDKVIAVNGNTVTLSNVPTGIIAGNSTFTFTHAAAPNIQLITIGTTATSTNVSYQAGDVIRITVPTSLTDTTTLNYTVQSGDIASGANSAFLTCANITQAILTLFPNAGVFNLEPGPLSNTIELIPTQVSAASSGLFPLVSVQTLDSAQINENAVTDYYNFSNLSSSSNVLGANGYSSALGQASFYNGSGYLASAVTSTTYTGSTATGLNSSSILHGPVYAQMASFVAPSTVSTTGTLTNGTNLVVSSPSSGAIQVGDLITDLTSSAISTNLLSDTVLAVNGNNITLSKSASSFTADSLVFTHTQSTTTTATATQNSSSMTWTSSPGVQVGVQVGDIVVDTTHPSFTAGLKVSTVGLNSVTLSGAITAAFSGDTISFVHSGITETFNLYADPGYIAGSALSAVGFTLKVPTTQAVITNITPLLSGTIAQQNLALDGSNATFQWASVNGVADMSQPLASVTLTTQSNNVASINATLSNLSINNNFYKAVGSTLPSSVTTNLTGQVYSLSGFVYSQYNSNASTPPTSYSVDPSKIPMPGTDFDYVVQGGPGSDIFLSLNTYTVPPVAVTPTNPNANINLDVVAQTASKGTYSLVVNLPNNASNVVFTPSAAFSVSTNISNGHLLTISGQYSPSNLSAAPILGTINVTLNNELNKGSQFSIDSVSTPTNVSGIGQALYFGTAETNASGQYSINNLPAGQMSFHPFNNPGMAQSTALSVNDALAAMSIAAGLGVPQGQGKVSGSAANLLPSDFVAADWNHDGTVTAADALGILSYYVSVNKNPSAMTYSYLPAQSNSLAISTESVSNVSTPAITPFMTNLNILSAVPLNTGGAQTLDLVGALSGNIVAF